MDVRIFLWGTYIGKLRYNEITNESFFQYDKNFIKMGIEISPIIMPLSEKTYAFSNRIESNYGLPPMLRDSLPDTYGNKLINIYLENLGRKENSLTPAERLCYEGKRGMGALEFEPEFKNIDQNSKLIDISKLYALSNQVLYERKRIETSDVLELINISTSAGGQRAKAVVQYNQNTKVFKSGQIDAEPGFDYYLIKFDEMNDEKYYTRIEYAYYLMCKDCDINISDSFLLNIDGKYHFLTKRFDREINEGKTIKKHVQTLAALENLDYEKPNTYDYENLPKLFYILNISNEKEEMFKRIVFNIIGANNDDHVKNISFIMNKMGKWSLAPAYDMTYAKNLNGTYCKRHQINLNNKSININLRDMLELGKKYGINNAKCKEIINKTNNVFLNFEYYAEKSNIPKEECVKLMNNFEILK